MYNDFFFLLLRCSYHKKKNKLHLKKNTQLTPFKFIFISFNLKTKKIYIKHDHNEIIQHTNI